MVKTDLKAVALKDTGERMVPEFHRGSLIYAEHITRYQSARALVEGKIVLDIASGSGYGTKILAESAHHVYGVDVDSDTVRYSSANFSADNITYKVGDGQLIPMDDHSVDVVTTFETIEHIEDYRQFMSEIKRVLKPDGIALISTPNELEFADGNHFHLHEFTYQELLNLVKSYFKKVDSYFQGTWKYVAIGKRREFETEQPVGMPTYNYAPLNPEQYLYFYLVCSNRKIDVEIESIAALGEHYSERRIVAELLDKDRILVEREDAYMRLKEHAEQLVTRNSELERVLSVKDKEIIDIKESRAYKLANSAQNMKSKLTG